MKGPAQANAPGLCATSAESKPNSLRRSLQHTSIYQIRGLYLSAVSSVMSSCGPKLSAMLRMISCLSNFDADVRLISDQQLWEGAALTTSACIE